jgi:hypothetical protein
MAMIPRSCRIIIVLGLALASNACESISTTAPLLPLAPEGELTVTESWTATLPASGSASYMFSIPVSGAVQVTLLSVEGPGVAPDVTLGLAIGTPSGSSCTVTGVTSAVAGSTPQVTGTYNPGVLCARVSDPGNLPAAATVSLQIAHP